MAYQVFNLFGSITVNHQGAVKGLQTVEAQAQKTAGSLNTLLASAGGLATSSGLLGWLTKIAGATNDANNTTQVYLYTLRKFNQDVEQSEQMIEGLSRQFGIVPQRLQESIGTLVRNGGDLKTIGAFLQGVGSSAKLAGADIGQAMENAAKAVATGNSALLEQGGIITNLGPIYQKLGDKATQAERTQAGMAAIIKETALETEAVSKITSEYTEQLNRNRLLHGEIQKLIGQFVLPVWTRLLTIGNNVLQWVYRLDDAQFKLIATIAMTAAGVTGLVGALGLLGPVFTNGIALAKTLGSTLVGLATNPIALVIAAIAAVATAWAKAGKTQEEERKRLLLVGQAVMGLGKLLLGTADATWTAIVQIVKSIAALGQAVDLAVHGKFKEAGQVLKDTFNLEAWAAAFDSANKKLTSGFDDLASTIKGEVKQSTINAVSDIENLVGTLAKGGSVAGDVGQAFKVDLPQGLQTTGKTAKTVAKEGLSPLERTLETLLTRAREGSGQLNPIKTALEALATSLKRQRDALPTGSDGWLKYNDQLNTVKGAISEVNGLIDAKNKRLQAQKEALDAVNLRAAEYARLNYGTPAAPVFLDDTNLASIRAIQEALDVQGSYGGLENLPAELGNLAGESVERFKRGLKDGSIPEYMRGFIQTLVSAWDDEWSKSEGRLTATLNEAADQSVKRALADSNAEKEIQDWLTAPIEDAHATLNRLAEEIRGDIERMVDLPEGTQGFAEKFESLVNALNSGEIDASAFVDETDWLIQTLRDFAKDPGLTEAQVNNTIALANRLEQGVTGALDKVFPKIEGTSEAAAESVGHVAPKVDALLQILKRGGDDLTGVNDALQDMYLTDLKDEDIDQWMNLGRALAVAAAMGVEGAAPALERLKVLLPQLRDELEGTGEAADTDYTPALERLGNELSILEAKQKAGLITTEQYRKGLEDILAQLQQKLADGASEGSDEWNQIVAAIANVKGALADLDKQNVGFWERFKQGARAALGFVQDLAGKVRGALPKDDPRSQRVAQGEAVVGAGVALAGGDWIGALLQLIQPLIEKLLPVLEPVITALAMLGDIIEPLIPAIGALAPIVGILVQLLGATLAPTIQLLAWIIEKVVAPPLTFVAKLIAGIWNAIAGAVNRVLGWAGVKLPLIELPEAGSGGGSPAPKPNPDGNKGGNGGTKVSEITGPTRDLLIDLLSPLAALDSQIPILAQIRDILDTRLAPSGAALGGAGGFNLTIESMTLYGNTGQGLADDFFRQLERHMGGRFVILKQGGRR